MHAKHDYNPLKTAYPMDSIPDFDEDEYPESSKSTQTTKSSPRIIIESEDMMHEEEDLALLEKSQQAAFHQSKNFQGASAYHDQGYHPSSTDLESKISWGLLVGCAILLVLLLLIAGGIFSLALMY